MTYGIKSYHKVFACGLIFLKVQLLAEESVVNEEFEESERRLRDMMSDDPYFKCIPIDPAHVQTIGHLKKVRDNADFGSTADDIDQVFDEHEQALAKMLSLCDGLKCTATEWKASSKALIKAKQLERKAVKAEQKRLEKQQEAAQKKKKKAEEALQKAAEEKAKAEADAGADQAKAAGVEKKRRIASKLMSELNEHDPPVLLARWPLQQIHVCESLVPLALFDYH